MASDVKLTQCETILSHLDKYESITSYEAFERYGITRLSGRIKELRDRGYAIVTDMVDNGTSRFARYHFEEDKDVQTESME